MDFDNNFISLFGASWEDCSDDVKKYIKAGADAVIVGSAYLKLIEKTKPAQLETKIISFTKSLKKETRQQ